MSLPSFPASLKRVTPWLIFAVTMTLITAGIGLMVLNRPAAGVPDAFGYREVEPLLSLAFASVGLVLSLRLPRNAVGWLFGATGALAALNNLCQGYAIYGLLTEPGSLPAVTFAAWAHNWLWVPLAGISEVFLLLLFPDGRVLPRFRPVARIAAIAVLVSIVGVAFEAGELEEFPAVINPVGVSTALEPVIAAVSVTGILAVIICTALGALSQFIRYRKADSDERHQIKWFAAAATIVAIAFALQLVSFAPEVIKGEPPVSGTLSKALETSLLVAIMGIPIATGVAMLRYRLYDIDIIINRTLVYLPLTALLAGLYVALTGLLRTVFTEVTETGSDAAIALSTLAVVAVLTPAKNQLQALVYRHFKETPEPAAELSKLAAHARSVLQVVETERFIEEFLRRATTAFEAKGGAVSLALPGRPERQFCVGDNQSGDWQLQLPLQQDGTKIGSLCLGPRSGRRPYSSAEAEAVAKAAEVIVEVAAAKLPRD